MLLHSGDAIHPYNRFDILVADPVTTLTTRARNHGSHTARTPSLSTIRYTFCELNWRLCLFHPQPDPDLPLSGRRAGVLFGYDLGRRFEIHHPILPRAISLLPDMAVAFTTGR